jgi:hypothetical protein
MIANESGKAANPTRTIVTPPGEVKLIPAAAAALTGFVKYLKLIRLKMTANIIRGSRRITPAIRDEPFDPAIEG